MNRRYLHATVAAASLFGTLFVAVAWLAPAPRLLWNASASAPIGLYRIDPGATPRAGDLVAIRPSPPLGAWLAERQYLPAGVPLLKRVAALPGARICRSGVFVTIDGLAAARAMARDRLGRPLPFWLGCRIVGPDELFLLNAAPDSLDGRYFGPLPAAGLLGVAHPVMTRPASGAPLSAHRPSPDQTSSQAE
ncbi:conjugal transfer protein [Sphingopyxis lindanitolerans]|jgi:conjugative transfer signal peptidase TraF|uniref:Conjugal transfer protein n=1 Tax=Sphingopyxis lindanitolerans TaxID=2054227 RepID=A0A2S8B0N4_9SPHN|nr:S26 family signal peptidase [Sphingopyxis lindanitolerans]PQM25907.1 conjugal transfer protein [Sphingopyxis lindanitolerans]